MCGVLGYIGSPDASSDGYQKRARAIEALLYANAIRGTDATGVATIMPDGKTTIVKNAVDAYEFIRRGEARALLRQQGASIVIGHTRLGTMGPNTRRNAHPFAERSITGAHNGIITNYDDLEAGKWKKSAEVDSQSVFRLLSTAAVYSPTNGFGDAYAKLLTKVRGSMVLTWTDSRDPGYLYVFAHDNPLSMATTKDAMFWSSQADHLMPVMQAVFGKAWQLIKVPEDTLCRIRWEDNDALFQEWPVKIESSGFFSSRPYTDPRSAFDGIKGFDCESCGSNVDTKWYEAEDFIVCKWCYRDYRSVMGGMTPTEFIEVQDIATMKKLEVL